MRIFTAFYLACLNCFIALCLIIFFFGGALLAIAMSFDSGFSWEMLIIDILIIIVPLGLQLTPIIFSWRAWHQRRYAHALYWTLMNWAIILGLYFVATGIAPWLLVSKALMFGRGNELLQLSLFSANL